MSRNPPQMAPFPMSLFLTCPDRVKNPLVGIPRAKLLSDVEAFCRSWGLTDITDTMQKGALVAQDPAHFEEVPGLTAAEHEALTMEVTKKWHQPKAMYYTVILCSIGAAVQGWDQVSTCLTDAASTAAKLSSGLMAFTGRIQRCQPFLASGLRRHQ